MKKKYNLFLLRGLTRESAHWGSVFESTLSKKIPNSRLFHLESPGTGQHYKEVSPVSLKGVVLFIREGMKKILKEKGNSKDHRNILIAISLGGMISIEWMRLFPYDFDGIIIMNTSFPGLNKTQDRLRYRAIVNFIKIAFSLSTSTKERNIVELVSNRPEKHQATSEKWTNIQKERPVSAGNAIRQLIAASRSIPIIKKPLVPVLLLASEKDRLAKYTCSVNLHLIWGCPLVIHPRAGHDLTGDEPNWVVDNIEAWMTQKSI